MNARKFLAPLALFGALVFAGQASAAVVTLDFAGFKNGSRSGTITADGTTINNAKAGQFLFSVVSIDGTPETAISDPLAAFCIEANIFLDTTDASYLLESASSYFASFAAGTLDNLKQLFSQFYGSIGTRDTDAAFQLALWEIVYDSDNGFDLGTGDFKATGFSGALGIAAGWLASLGTGGSADLWTLRAPHEGWDFESQDLIFVPEPGTLALLGMGLVALGASRRRKLG